MAGLEDDAAGGVSNGDVEPCATRRECGGKLVAGQVLDGDGESEVAICGSERTKGEMCGLGLEEGACLSRCGGELGGRRGDGEFIVMFAEKILHEEVGAGKRVTTDIFARRTSECCDGGGLADGGHVAGLAGLFVVVVAVKPLEVRHLFGEAAGGLSGGVEGGGVKGMAGAAEGRLLEMIGLGDGKAGGEIVNGDGARLSSIGTVERTRVLADRSDGEIAVVGVGRAQSLRLGLVADGAGNAVRCGCVQL